MIDLHNHILPAIDDGSRDLEESVDIARRFAAEGVERIAATPHLDPLNGRGARPDLVLRLVEEVQNAVRSAGIVLQIFPGNELYLTSEAPHLLASGAVVTLAGGPYVLVEISLTASGRPSYLDHTLFRLQGDGYRPVLAHPERYPFVQRDVHALDTLIERDVALQLTAPSLLGEYGRRIQRTAERLLGARGYRLAASDRHRPTSSRSLADLHRRLTELQGATLADLLLRENPRRVLDGAVLVAPGPEVPAQRSLLGRLLGSDPP